MTGLHQVQLKKKSQLWVLSQVQMTQFKNNLCTPNLKSNSKCLMRLSPDQDILAYNCEESACCSLPFPIIADSKRELAVALGMLDPDEKDKDGMPLTARCVGFLF